MSLFGRLVGGIVGGGGGFVMTQIVMGYEMPIVIGVSAALALAGLFFGAKIWEVVAHAF